MTGWRRTNLRQVCEEGGGFIRTGPFGSQLHKEDYVPDPKGIPVVMPKDMKDGRIDVGSIARIDQQTADRLSHHLLEAGDIVLSRRGDVGRTAWVGPKDVPVLCGTGSMRIHPGKDGPVDHEYLRYFMRSRSAIDYLEGHAVGATMLNLNAGIVEGLPICIPPRSQQAAVAAILTGLEDLIENNRWRIELLEQMAQTIYREWFVNFRYPGHEDVPLVQSSLGPIPQGWAVSTIGEVATVNAKSRKPVPEETIRYLDISSLGARKLSTPDKLSGEFAPGRARRVLNAGDIVWSMVRPGRRAHALLVEPGEDWIASTGLAVLSADEMSSALLFETLSTQKFSRYLVAQEGGSAYPAVKPRDFEVAPILRPSVQIDQAFDAAVSPMHRLGWQLREASEQLAALRDLLLPKLVTGEIDVSDLDLDAVMESVA